MLRFCKILRLLRGSMCQLTDQTGIAQCMHCPEKLRRIVKAKLQLTFRCVDENARTTANAVRLSRNKWPTFGRMERSKICTPKKSQSLVENTSSVNCPRRIGWVTLRQIKAYKTNQSRWITRYTIKCARRSTHIRVGEECKNYEKGRQKR